jgi:cyanophycinase
MPADQKQQQQENQDRGGGAGRHPRTLVIIGGHEDREGRKTILREVARRVRRHGRADKNEACGRVVVTTVASHSPEGYFPQYQKAFTDLGVADVVELPIADRSEANDPARAGCLDGADGLFFTGGDQLKLTSQMGDTPVLRRIRRLYEEGGVVAGTSAGASALCDTMLVRGTSQATHRIGDLHMAPGLGFIRGVIIDQHFAERGRMGRLLGAVAHNPDELGIGIDEDTAIIVEDEARFTVIGSGAVYVVDGDAISYSNIADEREERVLSLHDVRVHVLSDGDAFDLRGRRPEKPDPSR